MVEQSRGARLRLQLLLQRRVAMAHGAAPDFAAAQNFPRLRRILYAIAGGGIVRGASHPVCRVRAKENN